MFDDHISGWFEFLITLTSGLAFLLILEPLVTQIEFKFPHKEYFGLRSLITNFIKHHDAIDEEHKARVALSLINSDRHRHEIELNISFVSYLKLLGAATELSQTTWFATYRMPIGKWNEISAHSRNYFQILEKRRLIKYRVVVAPAAELNQLNQASQIVKDTKRCRARLGRVPKEQGFSDVKDYALFDDLLAITAIPLNQGQRANGEAYPETLTLETPMSVRLLKGDKVTEYLEARDRLLGWLKQHPQAVFKPTDVNRRPARTEPPVQEGTLA